MVVICIDSLDRCDPVARKFNFITFNMGYRIEPEVEASVKVLSRPEMCV